MTTSSSGPSDDAPRDGYALRWQRSLHGATEPLFLLNRQRRLLYANPAWERLANLSLADARGRACRRRPRLPDEEPIDQVMASLAPPPEALAGRSCQSRRRAPGAALAWWEIDFFPWQDAAGLRAILGRIRVIGADGPAHAALPENLVQLRHRSSQPYRLESWRSEAHAVHRLVEQMRLAARTRLPALLVGPPGCGKEWAARTIHHLGEGRESFLACLDARLSYAALAQVLTSSRPWRLGTLYLKNLERLPRDVQALLLQHFQAEPTETAPRLLAGSAADLPEEVRAGRLLPELHCRCSALTLQVPALTDRLVDLPHLLEQMLPRAAAVAEKKTRRVSPEALEVLCRHAWPGNLGELHDILVQACQRAPGDAVEPDNLPFYLHTAAAPVETPLPLDEILAKVERRLIELAMRLAQNNKTRAAELLAIWRPRLLRRLDQLGMAPANEKDE